MFSLAYLITFVFSFPLNWIVKENVMGPKPEFENYTAVLKQIPDFSKEVPTYLMTLRVILV
jgi:hypothetical protein